MGERAKLILIFFAIFAFAVVSFLTFVFGSQSEPVSQSEITEQQAALNETLSQAEGEDLPSLDGEGGTLTNEEVIELLKGDVIGREERAIKLGDVNLPEYPQLESDAKYSSLLRMLETADYQRILDEIATLATKYKFHESYNWRFGALQYDATTMLATASVPEEQRGQMVLDFQDPITLLTSVLFLPEASRRVAIESYDSLTPIFDGAVRIQSHERFVLDETLISEDKTAKAMQAVFPDLEAVHVIDFVVEQHPMVAYIAEQSGMRYRIYTLQHPEGYTSQYQTIRWWMEFDAQYE